MSETKLFVLDVRADHETRAVSLKLSDDREQLLEADPATYYIKDPITRPSSSACARSTGMRFVTCCEWR